MNVFLPLNSIAFAGTRCLAKGATTDVVQAVKQFHDSNQEVNVLIFDALTSHPVEFDLRGSLQDVLKKVETGLTPPCNENISESEAPQTKKVGRPKLGVKAREVTLLPKHWQWLAEQPGSASVTLRKLVQAAMTANEGKQSEAQIQESIFRFINAIAGNEVGFEEVVRALYSNDKDHFKMLIETWPVDIKNHVLSLYNNG